MVACSYNREKKKHFTKLCKSVWRALKDSPCYCLPKLYHCIWTAAVSRYYFYNSPQWCIQGHFAKAGYQFFGVKALQSEGMLLVNDDTVKAMVWIYIYKLAWCRNILFKNIRYDALSIIKLFSITLELKRHLGQTVTCFYTTLIIWTTHLKKSQSDRLVRSN